jgi:hypothetical protein
MECANKNMENKMMNNMRDVDYGCGSTNYTWSGEVTDETKKEKLQLVRDEINDTRKDINRIIDESTSIGKDEKKTMRKLFSKRLSKILSNFEKTIEETEIGDISMQLDDIEDDLDEQISKMKNLATELSEDLDNDYSTYSPPTKSIYDYEDKFLGRNYKESEWNRSWESRGQPQTTLGKDYSKDMIEVKSDRCLKIKLDVDSLNEFLAESDGKNENIAVLTADNRDYDKIEDVIFKVRLLPPEIKYRSGGYTEAKGKEIADALMKVNCIKCGWIHTHPFGPGATFFSGTDETTTKEMCVLPDDYCLAVVVACSYTESASYMNKNNNVVKEFELNYNLGKMAFRKVEIPNCEYDAKTDKIKTTPDLKLAKYECEITLVDKNGIEVDLPKPDPVKFGDIKTDTPPTQDYFE